MSDSQRLRAIIEGDARGAVRAFDQVADGAEKMGRDVDTASKKAGRSLKDFENAGRQVGQGLALLGGAFALASRDVVANEQAIRTLERGYGDTADSLRDFADEIQRTTTFSNEAAITAANNFRTLADNYGFTADQIETLITVSADLAATTGLDLADAAFRVQSAMRGEAEAAELLGLTLNDSALGIDHLAKSTTDAEKSQIRYNALLDQSAFAQGAAAERAATTAGQVEQLANRVQDATQDFVQWTGPIGEAAGSLGAFGLQAGLAAGGLVQLGRGLVTAAPLVAGLATGPVGLSVLAAGAIAAGAAFLIMRDDADQAAEGLLNADAAAKDLISTWNDLAQAGDPTALLEQTLGKQLELVGAHLTDTTRQVPELRDRLKEAREELLGLELDLESLARGGSATEEQIADLNDRIGEQTALVFGLESQLATAEGAAELFADAELALTQILRHQGEGADVAIDAVLRLAAAWDAGQIDSFQFAQGIIEQENALHHYDQQAIETTLANERLATSFRDVAGITEHGTRIFATHIETQAKSDVAIQRTNQSTLQTRTSTERLNEEMERLTAGTGEAARSFEDVGAKSDLVVTSMSAQTAAYHALTEGTLTASEAQTAFKITQDGLIESQGVYSHQQSEYESQLGSLQEAEDILNQRRAEGVALTADQVDFLERVDAAQERLTGGAEDAAIAEGMLALQYAENVRIGDQLNDTMEGQQAITGALIDLVFDLILALDGIPEDVRTDIELAGADAAIGQAASLSATLAGIPTSVRTEIVTAFVQTGTPSGLSGFGGAGISLQHGGVVHAQHGAVLTEFGESGPELARFPGGGEALLLNHARGMLPTGTAITPSPASMLAMNDGAIGGFGGGGGGSRRIDVTISFNGKGLAGLMNGNHALGMLMRGHWGMDDLTDAVLSQLRPALRAEIAGSLRAHDYGTGR